MAGEGRPGRVARSSATASSPSSVRRRRAGDIVLLCDQDLICDYAAPTSRPFLGYLPESLTGRSIRHLVEPADLAALRRFVAEATSESPSLPVRLRQRGGDRVEMVATRNGDHDVDLAPKEIADRVRLEEWLATHRALSDGIVNLATDAIVSLDGDGVIVEWNRAAEGLLGWSREEALGRRAAEMIVPFEERAALDQLLNRERGLVADPTPASLRHRDGRAIATELTSWSVQVGLTWRFNTLIRDVTARNEFERALTEAREQADEASRLKSEFLATMSHEIRTPMNGVIGLADILLGTELDRDQRRYAEGIRTAGAALLTVINDILDFSKAEAGMVVLDEGAFDPRVLLEEVVDILAGPAQAKGLELVAFCRPEVPAGLLGDRGRLRQVLVNLCANAVKFTDHGQVVLTASQAGRDEHGRRIRFEVSDTGIGIRAEDVARMFDAFSQADASTTRRYGGTGLGLAISQRFVAAMGGRINVISDLGVGSTFWFELPLAGTAALAGPSDQAAVLGLRVLVVDDNATNRFVLETQLREWHMAPTAVGTGTEALTALRTAARFNPYHVAVLDLAMPTMDGLELARAVTTDPDIPTPHIVLLTSGAEVDPAVARTAGVASWLTKPVHRSELFNNLAFSLDPARLAVPPVTPPDETPDAGRGRVLLAEDNEINQMVAVGMLTALGYRVDVAETGLAALELAWHHPYDAILMDCQMPELDGYAATEELRRTEGDARHTPVIALTAGARAEDRDRCLAAGMDDFVAKPIERDALASTLERWTASQQREGAAP